VDFWKRLSVFIAWIIAVNCEDATDENYSIFQSRSVLVMFRGFLFQNYDNFLSIVHRKNMVSLRFADHFGRFFGGAIKGKFHEINGSQIKWFFDPQIKPSNCFAVTLTAFSSENIFYIVERL
jgi:hypothetical protein